MLAHAAKCKLGKTQRENAGKRGNCEKPRVMWGGERMRNCQGFVYFIVTVAMGHTSACPHTCWILISGPGVLRRETEQHGNSARVGAGEHMGDANYCSVWAKERKLAGRLTRLHASNMEQEGGSQTH